MKRIMITLMAGLLGIILITGCERDTSSVLTEEQLEDQSIRNTITDENIDESDYLADWGIDDLSEENMYDGFSTFSPGTYFPKIMSPIDNVVRFGRKLNRRTPRTLVIRRISPDSILVQMERVWAGQFFIFQRLDTANTPPDTVVIYRKPLIHVVQRNAIFVPRVEDQEAMRDPQRRWKLSAISLGYGESRPAPTVEIHQVEVNGSNGTHLLFTNPLRTMLSIPGDLPTFITGETVTITILVSNNTANPVLNPNTGASETALLHFGVNRFHRARRQFAYLGVDPNTGHNIYQGEWIVHEPLRRPFHAIIDVLDSGTIYDDDTQVYPYNSVTWGVPYRVTPMN